MEGFIIGKSRAGLSNCEFVSCILWFNPTRFNNLPNINRFLKEAHTSFPIAIICAIKGSNRIKSLKHGNKKIEVKRITLKNLI
jgi:hypothetical protein